MRLSNRRNGRNFTKKNAIYEMRIVKSGRKNEHDMKLKLTHCMTRSAISVIVRQSYPKQMQPFR